ncbi:aminotransferase class V-fold PLP-dependent enzyme [Paenibacillus sp. NFR01]|uniref:aminotransferase class V-fold PLP-dependent enzyme n=1 Tax=Paenibacillus sp. NFR01 TaxID=1566279 RepID=UPI0008C0C307|nr:aminotransferase class V-fold PLP-dependent enzyme [Paenibacillus sp. NFR01]SEU12308.1 Selenocysteine lyase/Cysteine desulfurase [Paenibacillus sp. NFR01]
MSQLLMSSAANTEPALQEDRFAAFRENTVGSRHLIDTPYGRKPLLYADWTASGRLYGPIEQRMLEDFGPLIANPHTESSMTGRLMTRAYDEARSIIRRHVHAGPEDALLFCGNGTTSAVNKLIRLMGLRLPDWLEGRLTCPPEERPVVFVSHMEHHSNLLPWQESVCDVVTVPPAADGGVDPQTLEALLYRYRSRRYKLGSFTACSNVTGIETPYPALAAAMHRHGGLCFVDFAASAPYADIHMHPASPLEKLDAVFFSPHKFLGGPGTGGVLVFDKSLCGGLRPDEPGGGTVMWVHPGGKRRYIDDVEVREDSGTPGFLQAIRTALCIRLKEQMNDDGQRMIARERELCGMLLDGLSGIAGCTILAGNRRDRLGIVSFTLDQIHYNLAVQLLSDRFGIQARGGCSCAGPYGYHLLGIGSVWSQQFIAGMNAGDQSLKPGWVRISLHPTMEDDDVRAIVAAVADIAEHGKAWMQDYRYSKQRNAWVHRSGQPEDERIADLFQL